MRLTYHKGRPVFTTGAPISWDHAGRVAQKRRTRSAIVGAAAELLRRGLAPSVADAAQEADVSRATAYRYFPSQHALLLEASLELELPRAAEVLGADAPEDPVARIDLVAEGFQTALTRAEATARSMLLVALEGSAADGVDPSDGLRDLRAGRRIEVIEEALAPAKPLLTPRAYEQLVDSLCAVIGIDALVVARDLRGRTGAESVAVSRWAARALVESALRQASPATPGRRSTR